MCEIIDTLQTEIYEKVTEKKENFIRYVENIGMKNNDIFVDSGYRGTLQGVIHKIAHVDVKGVYVTVLGGLTGNYCGYTFKKKSFLPLDRSYGGALLEVILTELRGTTIGYTKEGKPILSKDSKFRRDISKEIFRGVLNGCRELCKENIIASSDDCATIFKRLMDSPTIEEANFGNQPLFENGSNEDKSIVWFNKDWIRKGKVMGCYNKSYWKKAFLTLLRDDSELSFLEREIK